jgi:uncharacterized protein YheU (UPF0270 family)
MDDGDVLHALREAGRVKDSLGDKKSSTMERLRDGQVKFVWPDMNNTLAVKDE